MPEFDQRSFRSALGRFATGVTVITARGADGRPVGVTANSFNSVSLDPPLILWSLSRTSNSLEAFESSNEFAIHVLGVEQEDLSSRFATPGVDKFQNIAIAADGVPLLEGCAARFECRKHQRYDVGDHVLFIGEVMNFSAQDDAPLLYLQGRYGEARRREAAGLSYDLDAARLGEGAILNLFSRAHVHILGKILAKLDLLGLKQPVPLVLVALAQGLSSVDEVAKFVRERGYEFSENTMQSMIQDGLISRSGNRLLQIPSGAEVYSRLLSALREVEDSLTHKFTAGELSDARHFLAKVSGFDDGKSK